DGERVRGVEDAGLVELGEAAQRQGGGIAARLRLGPRQGQELDPQVAVGGSGIGRGAAPGAVREEQEGGGPEAHVDSVAGCSRALKWSVHAPILVWADIATARNDRALSVAREVLQAAALTPEASMKKFLCILS